jgi:molybdenum cofactor cytidylyltransferase
MRSAAIVLAAGEGRRMGGPKALLPLRGTTFLSHVCRTFVGAGVELTIAVLGAQAESVRRSAGLPGGVRLVFNDRWDDGMLSSVLRGLDLADAEGADGVLLHPVDVPLVSRETVRRVAEAVRQGHPIVIPSCDGRRGHPAGFSRALFGEIREAPPAEGVRALLARDPARIVYVDGDPGCIADVDTPDDYRRVVGDGEAL